MSFFHPSLLLWFLPLAVVPLILHLLTLHRLKTVELSTFRFLFDSYVQQRRRMQFIEALLAILRVLFLLALVFVFGRPMIKHWDQLFGAGVTGGGRDVVLLVDCSASMNARTAGTASIDRARKAATAILERLGRDDLVTLIRVGSQPEQVLHRVTSSAKEIADGLNGLKPASSRANWLKAFDFLFGETSTARHKSPHVYLFTDCQASGWNEIEEMVAPGGLTARAGKKSPDAKPKAKGTDEKPKSGLRIPEGTPLYVVNVGSSKPIGNLAVIGEALNPNRTIAGLPVTFTARVVNYSQTVQPKVTLTLYVDEKEIAQTVLAKLEPGQERVHRFLYTPRDADIQKVRYEIKTADPDPFPDDDRFLFTLNVVPRIKVVLVNGNKNTNDPFEDEGIYLLKALSATAEDPVEPGPGGKKPLPGDTQEILRSLDVQEITEPVLNAESLRDASVVILANCGAINSQQIAWLRDFVSAGGGLLILPGDKVVPALYNAQFFAAPSALGETLTAATLGPLVGDPEKAETFATLTDFNFTHPALAIFETKNPALRHFATVVAKKRFKLQLPEKKGEDQRFNALPLISFKNEGPALIESRLGDGQVIVSAFPFHARWTNLVTKPDFVPLVLRLVAYLEHRPEASVSPVVAADGVAEIAVTRAWSPAEASVRLPSGVTLPQSLERLGSLLLGAFDRTSERGYYGVDVKSTSATQGKAAKLAFAVNLAPEESEFALFGETEFQQLLPDAKLTFVDATAEKQQVEGPVGDERELYGYLIWAVFLIIGAEFMLATTSGRKRELEEAPLSERIMGMTPGSWVGRMTGGGAKREA